MKLYQRVLDNPSLLIVTHMDKIEVHTLWTNRVPETNVFPLQSLTDATSHARLNVFSINDIEVFKPGRTRQQLTEDVAEEFVDLAQRLRERGYNAEQLAHFVNRMVSCKFAKDVRLLPNCMFTKLQEVSQNAPDQFVANAQQLFKAVAHWGRVGYDAVECFNGGLFDESQAFPLERKDTKRALAPAKQDCSNIDPSSMSTLFQCGLDQSMRSQLGAHYTDPEKIMMIINLVIVELLTREWKEVRAKIETEMANTKSAWQVRSKL